MAKTQNVFRLLLLVVLLVACSGATSDDALCSDLDEVTREWFTEPPDPDNPVDPAAYEALYTLAESAQNHDDEAVVSAGRLLEGIENPNDLVMGGQPLLVEVAISPIEEACSS